MEANDSTRLILVRHGEVEARYQRVFGGRIDMDLSPLGLDQARQTAEFLRPARADALYVSPMRRAQQTVAPIAAALGREPVTIHNLREVDFGAWTGHTWEEVRTRFGASAFDWLHELERGTVPEGEPLAGYLGRVQAALDGILERHAGQSVCLVCHGGVIRAVLALLLEIPVSKAAHFEIDYASVTVIHQRPHRPEIELLNFTPWRRVP